MTVDTRHQSECDRTADCFGDFALVNRAQTSESSGLDATHGGNVFGHQGEVLFEKRKGLDFKFSKKH